jgi:hypothetical protein
VAGLDHPRAFEHGEFDGACGIERLDRGVGSVVDVVHSESVTHAHEPTVDRRRPASVSSGSRALSAALFDADDIAHIHKA